MFNPFIYLSVPEGENWTFTIPADEGRVSGIEILAKVGFAFYQQWRRRLRMNDMDYGRVAKQMRKAGVPLDTALQILLHRRERTS